MDKGFRAFLFKGFLLSLFTLVVDKGFRAFLLKKGTVKLCAVLYILKGCEFRFSHRQNNVYLLLLNNKSLKYLELFLIYAAEMNRFFILKLILNEKKSFAVVKLFLGLFILSSCVLMDKSFLSNGADKKAGRTIVSSQKPVFELETVEKSKVSKTVQKPVFELETVEKSKVSKTVQKPVFELETVEKSKVSKTVQKPVFELETVEKSKVSKTVQKPVFELETVEKSKVSKTAQKPVFELKIVESAWLAKYPEIYKEFKNLVTFQRKEVESMAKAVKSEFPNSHAFPYKLHIESIKEFNKKDSNIISVRTAIYIFTGGAHGMLYHVSWNWDKEKGKFISLDRYVTTSGQFKKLQSSIRNALSQKVESGFVNKDLLNSAISEKKNLKTWNIHNNNIVFMFDSYTIASYAAGPIEVTVPIP